MHSFDTYQHVKELKEAGFNEKQAAVIIKSLVESRDNDISHLATKEQVDSLKAQVEALKESTKEQIEALRESTKEQIEALRESTKEQIESLRESTKEQIEALKESTKAQVDGIKESTKEQIKALKEEMKTLVSESHANILRWMIGTMIALSGVILAGIKLL